MTTETLDSFITDVASLISSVDDEHEITNLVAEAAVCSVGRRLPAPPGGHPTIERAPVPLHTAPDKSWVTGVRGLEHRSTHTRALT